MGNQNQTTQTARTAQSGPPADATLSKALDYMWERHLSQILERVAALEIAASAVTAQRLTEAEREAAHSAAHKLAGTLGMFNLDRGSDLARELEAAYVAESPTHFAAESGKRLASMAAELRTMIENRKAGIETPKPGD